MQDYASISNQRPAFPEYLNFQVLREIGIERLQALSSDLWTDYNLHDPGVTILEVLCYAITDLGYRNNFDIQDLLALNPQDSNSKENNFFTPDEVLTCNPVTDLDLRKRIIDIPGVRNVQFEKVGVPEQLDGPVAIPYEPAIEIDLPKHQLRYVPLESETSDSETTKSETTYPRLHPRGLYTVCLDLDSQYRKNACGQLTRDWSSTIDEVKRVLCSTRSLGEDLYDIELLGEEEIGLYADIQLEPGADAEDVLVEIYVQVQAFLSPRLRFYTLQALLQKGKHADEIFAGRPAALSHADRPYWDASLDNRPYDSHGFIDTDELADLTPPVRLQTSDLYQVLLDVPGVAAVQKLRIASYINGLRQSQAQSWTLQLTPGYRPVLGIDHSKVCLKLGELSTTATPDSVRRRYYEQQAAYIKAIRDPYELDLSVPQGRHYDLADYYSIHHEFPLTYGIGEDGLPDSVPTLRKIQAQQLKGYLVFFDQLLANYLAQLSHVRELFSWELDNAHPRTYFAQAIDFPGIENILQGMGEVSPETDSPEAQQAKYLSEISEEPSTGRDRRSRFLDHILARFAESFTDYTLLNYQLSEAEETLSREAFEQKIIRDKTQFFRDYPLLSHDRFRGFNYCDCDEIWNTGNISGFQRRVSSLLGFQNYHRRDLTHYRVTSLSKQTLLSVRCSASGPSLITTTVYESEAAALENRDALLRVMLHPCFYARLTYSSFYQYGWEVRCTVDNTAGEETFTLRHNRYFPSRAERQQALEQLLVNIEQYYQQLFSVASESTSEAETPGSETLGSETPEADLTSISMRPQPTVRASAEPLVVLSSSLISAVDSGGGAWQIQLEIPIDEIGEPIYFTSSKAYTSEEEAIASGQLGLNELFTVIRQQDCYCGVVLLSDDVNDGGGNNRSEEDNKKVLKEISYFGHALKDTDGQVIAEPSLINHEGEKIAGSDRFISEKARELALQQWFCHLAANQNQFEFEVVPTENEDAWTFQLTSLLSNSEDNNNPSAPTFISVAAYATPIAAWEAATAAADSLRYRRRYINRTMPNISTAGIINGDGTLLMEASTNQDSNQDLNSLFRRFNNLDSFLRIEAVAVPVRAATIVIPLASPKPSAETTIQYRYQLLNRLVEIDELAVILLQSIGTYTDEETARDRFYQDVLAVLFEPGVICPTQSRDGFGFQLLSQPRNSQTKVAENVQSYNTEEARDEAIETLLVLVRTARYAIAPQPFAQALPVYTPPADNSGSPHATPEASTQTAPKYTGQIRPNDGPILLQSRWAYIKEQTAWDQGNILMGLIQEQKNFRTIEGDGVYGWELTNPEKDHIWARQYYTCESERTQAIKALQCQVNDEGFYVLEHILLRPRSQQIALAEVDGQEVDRQEEIEFSETDDIAAERRDIVPSHTPTPDITTPIDEMDRLLPIVVKPDDAQYPATDPDQLARHDPYSFWVSIVLPYWPKRFRDVDFRRFVESTLRLEAPAHIALKIVWVDVQQLHQFQTAYRGWLEQLGQYHCQGTACDLTPSLNALIKTLPCLRNVYPKAKLQDFDQDQLGDSPVLLNRTAIGNAND